MTTTSMLRAAARLVGGAAVLATLTVLAPGLAAGQPTQDACAATRGKKGDGADIQCRVNAVLAKHDAVIGKIKDRLASCTGKNCGLMQEHVEKMASAQSRAKAQHGRFKADDYEDLNTTRKARCRGKKNCLASPAELEVGPETDTGIGEDIVDQLAEIGEDLESTDELLDDAANAPAAAAMMAAAAAAAPAEFRPLYEYGNDPDYPKWLHVADNTKALIPASFALTFAAQAALKSSSVLENACQQDIFGTNTSVICLILDVVAVALDATAKLLAYNLSDATAWDAKGAYMRAADLNHNLGVVGGKVTEVGASVGNVQSAVAEIEGRADVVGQQLSAVRRRVIVAQNQIIQLLLTQEGRRSVAAAILTCDGITQMCPDVNVSCNSAGACTFR